MSDLGRRTAIVAVLSMLALVLAPVGPASAAHVACGQTIVASTVLDGDIGPCPAGGIVVGADNVTLDLGGHQVSGTPGTGDGAGIRAVGRSGVTVTNGAVTQFDAGVVIDGGSRNTVSRLRVNDDIGPPSSTGGPGDGIVVRRSNDSVVTDSQVVRNGPFSGISVISSSRTAVARNQVLTNDVVQPGSARVVSADSSETPGVWSLTGAMAVSRFGHTTTLLANGRVLVAGGRVGAAGGPSTATAEVFDPVTGTWSPAGSVPDARYSHTATLLPDGRVLVAGGFTGGLTTNAQPVLSSAALYDPATNSWAPTGSMNVRRAIHTATLLPTGKVLAAGGRTCATAPPTSCDFTNVTATAELYDPVTGTWTPTGSMAAPRHTTTAVVLPNGTVLLSGGFPGTGLRTAEIYDPATGTFSPTGSLGVGRSRQGTVLLPNGQVLVASGFSGRETAELYDPAAGTFSFTGGTQALGRFNFFFTGLPDGRVIVAGGGPPVNATTTEVYNPSTGSWQPAGPLNIARANTSSNANTTNAVVLSSDPDRFAIDPAVCGSNCGKVLVTGNSADTRGELFTALPGVRQGVGIWLLNADPGSPATGNVVDSNQVSGNALDGIQVSTFSDGNVVRYNQVVANGFRQVPGSPDRDGDGIAVFGNRNTIETNVVFNNAGNGISVRYSTTRAGAPAGGLENRILGNRAVGNDAKANHVTAYDLVDTSPLCDANVWSANGFGTAFPDCATAP